MNEDVWIGRAGVTALDQSCGLELSFLMVALYHFHLVTFHGFPKDEALAKEGCFHLLWDAVFAWEHIGLEKCNFKKTARHKPVFLD